MPPLHTSTSHASLLATLFRRLNSRAADQRALDGGFVRVRMGVNRVTFCARGGVSYSPQSVCLNGTRRCWRGPAVSSNGGHEAGATYGGAHTPQPLTHHAPHPRKYPSHMEAEGERPRHRSQPTRFARERTDANRLSTTGPTGSGLATTFLGPRRCPRQRLVHGPHAGTNDTPACLTWPLRVTTSTAARGRVST